MSDLLIKDIDENIIKKLTSFAEIYGKSVEDYAKDLLVEKVNIPKRMNRDEFRKYAEAFREKVGPQKTDSAILIREDRDNR